MGYSVPQLTRIWMSLPGASRLGWEPGYMGEPTMVDKVVGRDQANWLEIKSLGKEPMYKIPTTAPKRGKERSFCWNVLPAQICNKDYTQLTVHWKICIEWCFVRRIATLKMYLRLSKERLRACSIIHCCLMVWLGGWVGGQNWSFFPCFLQVQVKFLYFRTTQPISSDNLSKSDIEFRRELILLMLNPF